MIETQTGRVVPLEVKSGRSFRAHKALENLLSIKEFGIDYGIVLSRCNVEYDSEKRVLYLPVYMTMFLTELNAFAREGKPDDFRLEVAAV